MSTILGQTITPSQIPVVFGVQTLDLLEIDPSTGLLEEISSATDVSYSVMFNVDDTSINTIEVIIGSTEGSSDICNETYNYTDFTIGSTVTNRSGANFKYCSPAKNYQEDIYYEVLLYNSNGDCTYKGTGNSNN